MNWKKIVGKIAPALGTALSGPLGGAATKFMASKLLGESATEADLSAFIEGASPEELARIKTLDHEFQVQMRKLDIDLAKLNQEDRASARGLAQLGMGPHVVMSAVYTVMYGVVLYLLLSGQVDVPQNHMALVMTVVGILTAAQGQILSFWFGSSSGSKQKTAEMSIK